MVKHKKVFNEDCPREEKEKKEKKTSSKCTICIQYITLKSGLSAQLYEFRQQFIVGGIPQAAQRQLHQTLGIAELQCKLQVLSIGRLLAQTQSIAI